LDGSAAASAPAIAHRLAVAPHCRTSQADAMSPLLLHDSNCYVLHMLGHLMRPWLYRKLNRRSTQVNALLVST
jgi:hypothetical protein